MRTQCPHCMKFGTAPDGTENKKAKCQSCQSIYVIREIPPIAPPPEPIPEPELVGPPRPTFFQKMKFEIPKIWARLMEPTRREPKTDELPLAQEPSPDPKIDEIANLKKKIEELEKASSAKIQQIPISQPVPQQIIHVHTPAHKGGCGPMFIEILVSCLTAGVLGGFGPYCAGKGAESIWISIVAFLALIFWSVFSVGILVPVILPLWGFFVFVKFIIDLIRSA